MPNYKILLLLSIFLLPLNHCCADNQMHTTESSVPNVSSVDEKNNGDELVNILNDAMESQEDFSKANPATTIFFDANVETEKAILTGRNSTMNAFTDSINEQKDLQASKTIKSNIDDDDHEEILGSTASAKEFRGVPNQFNINNVLSRQERAEIATLTSKAIKNFDFEGVVDTFKNAHVNYKQDVEDATKDGTALRWQDKGLLGAKHYGGAYASVMLTIASETIKVAGPKLAMMLLTAIIAL